MVSPSHKNAHEKGVCQHVGFRVSNTTKNFSLFFSFLCLLSFFLSCGCRSSIRTPILLLLLLLLLEKSTKKEIYIFSVYYDY